MQVSFLLLFFFFPPICFICLSPSLSRRIRERTFLPDASLSEKRQKNNSHKSTRDLQSSNCSRRLFMSRIQESRKLFDSIEHILHAQYRGRGERQKKKSDFLHSQGPILDGKRSETTTKIPWKTTGHSVRPGSSSSNASGVVTQDSCTECFIVGGLLSLLLSLSLRPSAPDWVVLPLFSCNFVDSC